MTSDAFVMISSKLPLYHDIIDAAQMTKWSGWQMKSDCKKDALTVGCKTTEMKVCSTKDDIRTNLVVIGRYMYDQVMDGVLPGDDLYNLVMEALPLCFAELNKSVAALAKVKDQTEGIVHQIKQKVAADQIILLSEVPVSEPEERTAGVDTLPEYTDPDLHCLRELLWKTLQGAAWYAVRCRDLGADLWEYRDGFLVGLHTLADPSLGIGGLLSRVLEAGQLVCACAAMLTEATQEKLGSKKVADTRIIRPFPRSLVVTGADILALQSILKTAQQRGIAVLTGGELAAAHGYESVRSDNLIGHVVMEDQENDFSGARILCTDFLPAGPETLSDGKLYAYGLAGFDRAIQLPCLSGADADDLLWEGLDDQSIPSEPNVAGKFSTGWDSTSLYNLRNAILAGMQDGAVCSVDLVAQPTGMASAEWLKSCGSEAGEGWYLTAGSPWEEIEARDFGHALPQSVHLGGLPEILVGVQLLKILAGEMQTSVRGVPHRVLFPAYREELVGILFGLMSFGLQGFILSQQWQGLLTPRVLNLLQDRWQVEICEENTNGGGK
jgi:hypothetical protein